MNVSGFDITIATYPLKSETDSTAPHIVESINVKFSCDYDSGFINNGLRENDAKT